MTAVGLAWMVPGRSYRLTYRETQGLETYQGRYLGHEVTASGDVVIFGEDGPPEIYVGVLLASITEVRRSPPNPGSMMPVWSRPT